MQCWKIFFPDRAIDRRLRVPSLKWSSLFYFSNTLETSFDRRIRSIISKIMSRFIILSPMKFINFIFVSDFSNIPKTSFDRTIHSIISKTRSRFLILFYLSIWIKNEMENFLSKRGLTRVQLRHGLKMTRILFQNFFSIDFFLCVHEVEPFITLFSSPMMRMISCTTVEKSFWSARFYIYIYIYLENEVEPDYFVSTTIVNKGLLKMGFGSVATTDWLV